MTKSGFKTARDEQLAEVALWIAIVALAFILAVILR